ncbi:PLP-dependent transferase [Neolentinus lepideus HHB14362 ss-1]|uniref:PLP-dependent transferase n=1 Tax=Neolentinus lepideus HHB14362 ss-1 TaxID=1314782 RepID=A0A165TWZ1_9AGAM|nr:PLP-dependent transferase [Neolentinus lepideus HHB14362 ss-1]
MAVNGNVIRNGAPLPDLSHHLSSETRSRIPNPMKAIWRLAQRTPGVINMANGDPHHTLYPISEIAFKVPSISHADPVSAWRTDESSTQTFISSKDESCALSLREALQYGSGVGLPEVREVLQQLTDLLHAPTANHTITMSLGNVDAVTKCFRLLGDPGEAFLAEEFSFPGMTNAPLAHNIRWVPVRLDKEGMIPEDLERVLRDWDESKRGKRPHVLYTVPCGQNPTGSTLTLDRRKDIYDIACRWDLIILEDDPYYFLQYDKPPMKAEDIEKDGFAKTFARSLVPSFLSLDTEGRVMRIDSFSKIIAPGMRLGWITSNSAFAPHFENLIDSSTQHPHGLGQAFVTEMLAGKGGWHMDGFARWVKSLCDEYQRRRDFLAKLFDTELGDSGYASVEIPEAGMFLWIKINIDKHPKYQKDGAGRSNMLLLMEELFQRLLEAGVMMMPGYVFEIMDEDTTDSRCNHFRTTFAGDEDTMEKGTGVFGKTVRTFFES